MTEVRVGFLCNIAFNLPANNDTHKVLKSYYLMRCNNLTKGYGLPQKYFSSTARCSHCFLDWTRDSDTKLKSLKFNRRQRQRIRSNKKPQHNKTNYEEQRHLLQNEMIQVCTFCQLSTKTQLIKPEREYKSNNTKRTFISKVNDQTTQENKKALNKQEGDKKLKSSKEDNKNNAVNLYSNSFDVFSLRNDKNTLSSKIKVQPKVIKNNKKRKDKFAGLCQKAVLASAKLKEQQGKQTQQPPQNKLNLFLKPSSG